jgi:hypothetical protein
MDWLCAARVTCLLAAIGAAPVFANDGIFVPASGRRDMVHDAARNRVYISAGGQILRYATKYDAFRSPIVLGGNLGGIDISPDGNTLVVADRSVSGTQAWVWLVDLDTLVARKMPVPLAFYEAGTYTAVYGADGMVYTTSSFAGSGWTPFRRLNPQTGVWTSIVDVRQDTMLATSGDGKVIAFAESNISDGRWGRYDIPTQALVQRQWYTDGTSTFNYEITTNRDGSRYLINGNLAYDAAYQKVGTLPYGSVCGVYHPVSPEFYTPVAGSNEVRVYDADTLTVTRTLTVGAPFASYGQALGDGRTRISRDGSLLMVAAPGGLQVIRQYAPLAAEPVFANVAPGASVDIPLLGSIGTRGALSYALASSPSIGQATITGSTLHYTAPLQGTAVAFRYRVGYGRASVEADVGIAIDSVPNLPPVAVDDVAEYQGTSTVLIPVLLNDSDPDSDALQVVATTPPASGSVTIVGDKIQYTPGTVKSETFGYTVSDGRGGTDQALVTVTRRFRAPQSTGATRPLPRATLPRRAAPAH